VFDQEEAACHLLRRGLIRTAGSSSSVALDRLAGRNLVYRIEFLGTAPLLLKRAVDAETRRGLEREARAYDLIADSGNHISPAAPRKLDFDPSSSTLVLQFLSGHRPLAHPSRPEEWSPPLAEALGRTLARIHAIPPPAEDATPPWILSLVHPPIGILREASYKQLELIAHVQGSMVWRSALERLAEEWRPLSFVHGDLRLSNILVGNHRRSNNPELALVDWELAGRGDAAWDAGWVLAEVLASRLRRLSEALPLARAFWAGYLAEARDAGTHARLDSTLRWSAAACLQMAYEESRWPQEQTPTDKLLELGRSLLERPAVWIERVFTPPGR
jgi:aminoglycoside phosphotransferase (APT) family kinase protein